MSSAVSDTSEISSSSDWIKTVSSSESVSDSVVTPSSSSVFISGSDSATVGASSFSVFF